MRSRFCALSSGRAILAVGLIALGASWGLGSLASYMGGRGDFVGLIFGQAVIIAAATYASALGLPVLRWGGCWIRGISVGLIAWALANGLTMGLAAAAQHLWSLQLPQQEALSQVAIAGPAQFAFMVIFMGLIAPFCEEVYFRGWCQSYFAARFSAVASSACALPRRAFIASILFTAFIFALLHGGWAWLPGLFVAGVCFGVAAWRWGIFSAVVAHAVFNLITLGAARGGWL